MQNQPQPVWLTFHPLIVNFPFVTNVSFIVLCGSVHPEAKQGAQEFDIVMS